jgi:hypothetical protein
MKHLIEKSSRRISTVVFDCDIRKNLRRLAIAQNTSLSALINRASEEYIRSYLQKEVKAK